MSERVIVELSLAPGSLEELLAGPLCSRVALTPDPEQPGAYRLNATVPGDPGSEALMRFLYERAGDDDPFPPLPATTDAAVAADLMSWRYWFDRRDKLRGRSHLLRSRA